MPAQRHLSGTPPRFDDSASGECGRSVKKPSAAEQKSKILKEKTPIGKLEDQGGVKHPYQVSGPSHWSCVVLIQCKTMLKHHSMLYLQFKEKEPLPEHPGGVNPETGEVGGPRGPEPTRYGDWERKGRVTDF